MSPAWRMSVSSVSQSAAATGSGQKKAFASTAAQSHRAGSTAWAPIRTIAPANDDLGPEDFPRDSAGCHAHRGLASRGPAAAAIVADAVFQLIGEVGMARAEAAGDIAVVLRTLIDILDRQRRSGVPVVIPLEDAGQDSHLVRFLPLGGEARLTRPPPVQEGLDIRLAKRDARRATVDHAADRRPMALTPGRDAEKMPEGIVGHARSPAPSTDHAGDIGARPGSSCRRCGSRNRRDGPSPVTPAPRWDSR